MSHSKRTLLIALAAGGTNDELSADGIGIEHVEELMVRMAMRLFSGGHRLSFGGTLGDPQKELTSHLIDAAERWLAGDAAEQVDVTKPDTWPLINYSAWPHYRKITEEQRARLVGICQFINIDPPGIPASVLNTDLEPALEKKYAADALTAMRERSASDADLRVVWGGRIKEAAGWMAGILEEVAVTMKLKKPLLILGGFGGCARLIAEFLRIPKTPWPDDLSLAASADPARDALLSLREKQVLESRMKEVKQLVHEYRSTLRSCDSVHGLPSNILLEALQDASSRKVINTVSQSADRIRQS